ncbi:hypothetical protein VNN36_10115 [Lactococcus garvieae]|uniref:hypothetical protein n=1 Tax=Lactococcus garvieae TaxID=1363 RepID=UPI0030CDB76B
MIAQEKVDQLYNKINQRIKQCRKERHELGPRDQLYDIDKAAYLEYTGEIETLQWVQNLMSELKI